MQIIVLSDVFNMANVLSEPVFNNAILGHFTFEEPVSNTLETRKMVTFESFAGLNTENLKTISVKPVQNMFSNPMLENITLEIYLFVFFCIKKDFLEIFAILFL